MTYVWTVRSILPRMLNYIWTLRSRCPGILISCASRGEEVSGVQGWRPISSPIWPEPWTITPRDQISRSGSIPHFDKNRYIFTGVLSPPGPPPWKLELIKSALKLIKLYQASELMLDFWIFWIKSYQASELILDLGIFHEISDIYSYLDHDFG